MGSGDMDHRAELVVKFPSHGQFWRIFIFECLLEHALIAMQSLSVDEELQPNRILKSLTVRENSLYV